MLKQRRNRVVMPPPECALSVCVRFLHGVWTANILWYLGDQPRRFTELKRDLAGVSSKVLTTRLRRLTEQGLIRRSELATSPPSVEYSLTDLGRDLLPALKTLVEVGHKLKQRGATGERYAA